MSPFIFNNSMEKALVQDLMWLATHDVVSREINLWKSFDLLLGLNLGIKARLYVLF